MVAHPCNPRQRQVDPWSPLVSLSSLAYLVSSGPERDLETKKGKEKKGEKKRVIPEVVYIH